MGTQTEQIPIIVEQVPDRVERELEVDNIDFVAESDDSDHSDDAVEFISEEFSLNVPPNLINSNSPNMNFEPNKNIELSKSSCSRPIQFFGLPKQTDLHENKITRVVSPKTIGNLSHSFPFRQRRKATFGNDLFSPIK